jgi:hypothetical protein
MGAPTGNKNAKKGAEWRQAIKRALAHKSGKTFREGLDLVATQFVEAACNGDPWAMKEIGDRIDGKAVSQLELSGPDGSDLPIGIVHFNGKREDS